MKSPYKITGFNYTTSMGTNIKSTGIVRRIDELGRVVIPKEIRKTLRIREGDTLEFLTNREELILKKFSSISLLKPNLMQICTQLSNHLERDCLIVDTDSIICVSSAKNKAILGTIMSDKMQKIIRNRKVFTANNKGEVKTIKIYEEDINEYENQIVVPIISNGDCLGGIVVYDFNKEKYFTPMDEKLVKLSASFLAMQIDV